MGTAAPAWKPDPETAERIDALAREYRGVVRQTLEPLVMQHYPALFTSGEAEYRKMLELSTKMMLVGHACTNVAGYEFDPRRQRIAALFGGGCFLADSFLDDFGPEATRSYLRRFEMLLNQGWFEVQNDRERLFYVTLARLFGERDVLDPVVRQSICRLQLAQEADVRARLDEAPTLTDRRRLLQLKRYARDRSGHAIIALSTFLTPHLALDKLSLIYSAGALIMYIDDHGDAHADLKDGRITYMNQMRDPERALRRIFRSHMERLGRGFSSGPGRDLLLGFLMRYYRTRVAKHRQQKLVNGSAWDVYE
jgi:hypothetical protein